ncbi:hypothetical protein KAR91_34305 [Candidatus Pacearchaeota archaeon]|nr:hypothetical protein [Candidatus Pacearchaeota archaeon]
MIHVRVDMWPKGDESRKYNLFDMTMSNVGGDANKSDYCVRLYRRLKKGWPNVRPGYTMPLHTRVVNGHHRKRVHVSQLVAKAIAACYPLVNPPLDAWPGGKTQGRSNNDALVKEEK